MKQYRKYISMLFILIISCMVFTGCTKKDNEDSQMNSATVETATAAKSENADTVEPEDQNGVKTTEGSDDQVIGETTEEIESAEIELESGEASGGL